MFVKFLKIIFFVGLLVILYFLLSKILLNVFDTKNGFVYAPTVVSNVASSSTTNTSENIEVVTSTVEKVDNGDTMMDYPEILLLPKQVNQIVPFSSQAPEKDWSAPWQDACEETSLLMIDAYYYNYDLTIDLVKSKILEMIIWEEEKGWSKGVFTLADGMTASQTKELSEQFFDFKLKLVKDPSIEELKSYLAQGKLVMGFFDGKTLENPYFSGSGPDYHALVIKGYDENDFIVNDPGTKFGEDFTYSYENIMESLHDWNGGDVSNGQRVVLVLE